MPCYHCYYCLRGEYNWCPTYPSNREAGVFPYFVGTFADYYYLPPRHPVFKVPDAAPDSVLSFMNCALGTVTEALLGAGVSADRSVVLFGAGGLGLCASAISRCLGAQQVIMLDRLPKRLALARELGADEAINIDEVDAPEERLERIRALTGGRGADVVLELVGNPALMEEGVAMLASGGTFVQIGAVSAGATAQISPAVLLRGKRIAGSLMYRPRVLPLLLDIVQRNPGQLPFDRIVSKRYPLEEVNRAFEELEWHNQPVEVTRAVLIP
jgi:threonine dehydrogenase-like Zn-dependent dehydrogenase